MLFIDFDLVYLPVIEPALGQDDRLHLANIDGVDGEDPGEGRTQLE